MKKTKEQNLKTSEGITLIALIITIIVMLILVAVTITMAVDGGLFEKAASAGTKTNERVAQELEYANITADMTTQDLIDKYTNGTTTKTNCETCGSTGWIFRGATCDNCSASDEDLRWYFYCRVYCYSCEQNSIDNKFFDVCLNCNSNDVNISEFNAEYGCYVCGNRDSNETSYPIKCTKCNNQTDIGFNGPLPTPDGDDDEEVPVCQYCGMEEGNCYVGRWIEYSCLECEENEWIFMHEDDSVDEIITCVCFGDMTVSSRLSWTCSNNNER